MAAPLTTSTLQRRIARPSVTTSTRTLRLLNVLLVNIALVTFVVGTAWDIQWHVAVGRDRVLTPPHVMMLGGIIVSGLVSLLGVLWESWQVWRGNAQVREQTTRVLGLFYAPIGMIAAGTGALLAGIAFPLDDYWHTLYGIDVTLWAPFHVMIIMSMVLVGLGALITVAAEMNRASDHAKVWLQLAFAATVAIIFSTLLLLLPQANTADGLVQIGGYDVVLYPILVASTLPIALMTVALVTHLPGAATLLAVIFLALRQAIYWFVPWAVTTTAAAEGLAFRPNPPEEVITAFAYPTAILFAALVIDAVLLLLRHRNQERAWLLMLVGTGTAVLATFWDQPWARALVQYHFPELNVAGVFFNALPLTILGALAGVGCAVVLSRGLAAVRR